MRLFGIWLCIMLWLTTMYCEGLDMFYAYVGDYVCSYDDISYAIMNCMWVSLWVEFSNYPRLCAKMTYSMISNEMSLVCMF